MAQYFTDFTGESVGASPPTGWTARGDATAGWEVLTGPYAGYNTATFSNQYDFLTWDTVGSVTGDVEIVALMRFTNDSFPGGVAVHVQSGSVGGYPALFTFSGDAPALWLVSAGSDSNIDSDVAIISDKNSDGTVEMSEVQNEKFSLWTFRRVTSDVVAEYEQHIHVQLSGSYDHDRKTVNGGDKDILMLRGEAVLSQNIMIY